MLKGLGFPFSSRLYTTSELLENIVRDDKLSAFGNSDDVWHFKWGGKALSDSVAAVYTYNIDSLRALAYLLWFHLV